MNDQPTKRYLLDEEYRLGETWTIVRDMTDGRIVYADNSRRRAVDKARAFNRSDESARKIDAAIAARKDRDHLLRCPDCDGSIADHNSVNRVEGGLIAHSRTGGACWKSLNTEFTRALERTLPGPKKE